LTLLAEAKKAIDNCHFVFDFSLKDLLRGMLLRMRLAVTVLTGKSAILFSALQAEGHQHMGRGTV
jgi:hypothetical protein